jgi:hypothetical protein
MANAELVDCVGGLQHLENMSDDEQRHIQMNIGLGILQEDHERSFRYQRHR